MTFNSNAVTWLAFYSFFTLYLYYGGIKLNWQEIRIKSGLEKIETRNPPSLFKKCHFNNPLYFRLCTDLFLITMGISALIMLTFYIGTTIKVVDSFLNGANVFISLLFVYSVFVGVPVDNEDILDKSSHKIYTRVISIVTDIKQKSIKRIVNAETEYYQNMINEKIKYWYCKNEGTEIGALILRIESKFFNSMLPDSTDTGIKEAMQEAAFHLLKLYNDEDEGGGMTLLDELVELLCYEMVRHGAKIIELAEFISNHESISKSKTRGQIRKLIKDQISKKINSKIKTKSIAEVTKDISGVLPDEAMDEQPGA